MWKNNAMCVMDCFLAAIKYSMRMECSVAKGNFEKGYLLAFGTTIIRTEK